jgi:mannosyl-oligosaccharide alpha-1,2-mannosidase
MEFTRLAQLTKDARYYDAVARVTDALSEYQDRGTKLGNVFPENVDASGCNWTVPHSIHEPVAKTQTAALGPAKMDEQPEGYKPNVPQPVVEPRPNKRPVKGDPSTLEMEIVPGELSKAHIAGWDENRKGDKIGNLKRELPQTAISNRTTSPPSISADPVTGLPVDLTGAKSHIGDVVGEWDCTPQGLDTSTPFGYDKFSMGGGQDSTYEYFPKVCEHTWYQSPQI